MVAPAPELEAEELVEVEVDDDEESFDFPENGVNFFSACLNNPNKPLESRDSREGMSRDSRLEDIFSDKSSETLEEGDGVLLGEVGWEFRGVVEDNREACKC